MKRSVGHNYNRDPNTTRAVFRNSTKSKVGSLADELGCVHPVTCSSRIINTKSYSADTFLMREFSNLVREWRTTNRK